MHQINQTQRGTAAEQADTTAARTEATDPHSNMQKSQHVLLWPNLHIFNPLFAVNDTNLLPRSARLLLRLSSRQLQYVNVIYSVMGQLFLEPNHRVDLCLQGINLATWGLTYQALLCA